MKISMIARVVATAAALAATLASAPAHAADASTAEHAAPKQQTRMASCNKDAVGKKGDERKAFMKQCLSAGKAEGAAASASSDKAKACKAEAKGMRGNARKDFLKECESRAA
jgi:hypothetical protein